MADFEAALPSRLFPFVLEHATFGQQLLVVLRVSVRHLAAILWGRRSTVYVALSTGGGEIKLLRLLGFGLNQWVIAGHFQSKTAKSSPLSSGV